ncbi:hypothetical protein A6R71_07850 [Xanthomonas translucens pv. arrhenatheri]|nr:hypothetical protein A6R71_07850 [Xanthomonas translucens pv. arrhenatheri]
MAESMGADAFIKSHLFKALTKVPNYLVTITEIEGFTLIKRIAGIEMGEQARMFGCSNFFGVYKEACIDQWLSQWNDANRGFIFNTLFFLSDANGDAANAINGRNIGKSKLGNFAGSGTCVETKLRHPPPLWTIFGPALKFSRFKNRS